MKCQGSHCKHYVHMNSKLSVPVLVGKVAECNQCGDPFVLNRRALRFAKPKCDDCVNHKKETTIKSAEDFFSELEKEATSGFENTNGNEGLDQE